MEARGISMKVTADIEMGTDLCNPISPIAAALSDSLLSSRCSACFSSLKSNNSISCTAYCSGSVSYCSKLCRDLDLQTHIQSRECHLLGLLGTHKIHVNLPAFAGTCDIRAALRLLLHHHLAGAICQICPQNSRFGHLLTNRSMLLCSDSGGEAEAEFAENIREGARVMALARNSQGSDCSTLLEESALCQVVTNGVQVLMDETKEDEEKLELQCIMLGTAVYGPLFSWCNHSCRPNAAYRFVLKLHNEHVSSHLLQREESSYCLIEPEIKEHGGPFLSTLPMNIYGPMLVIRTLWNVKKGDHVFITYTSLLRPKKERQEELWIKYRFLCLCERCDVSRESYIDELLEKTFCDCSNLSRSISKSSKNEPDTLGTLMDELQSVIAEFLSDCNADSFCRRLEQLMDYIKIAEERNFPPEGNSSERVFRIHPLHYVCLDAYTSLSSAYRILAHEYSCFPLSDSLDFQLQDSNKENRSSCLSYEQSQRDNSPPFFKVAAAYALLLAGAVHHYFVSGEHGLAITVARFLMDAGELLIQWVVECGTKLPNVNSNFSFNKNWVRKMLKHASTHTKCGCSLLNELDTNRPYFLHHMDKTIRDDTNIVDGRENAVMLRCSKDFLRCMNKFVCIIWPCLQSGKPFLESIPNPVDYGWLGESKNYQLMKDYAVNSDMKNNDDKLIDSFDIHKSGLSDLSQNTFLGCDLDATNLVAIQCAVHCLFYSKYLTELCLGSDHSLVHYIKSFL